MVMVLMIAFQLVFENGFAIKYKHIYLFIHISFSNYHFHSLPPNGIYMYVGIDKASIQMKILSCKIRQ